MKHSLTLVRLFDFSHERNYFAKSKKFVRILIADYTISPMQNTKVASPLDRYLSHKKGLPHDGSGDVS